jgi:DnaJ family protein C protein 19
MLENWAIDYYQPSMMNSRVALKVARLARSHNPQIISQWSWQRNNRSSLLASCDFHSFALRRNDDDEQRSVQSRGFHTTPPSERAVALIMGLASLSAVGYAGSSAVHSYNEWKAAQPSPEEVEEQRKKDETEAEAESVESANAQAKQQEEEKNAESGPRKNVFKEWFDVGVGSKYYEGGFDEKMTKKEAALILGVRESSSPKRIKDAHRKLLILNHPDRGGSTYMSGKLNEAKELLLKGRAKV